MSRDKDSLLARWKDLRRKKETTTDTLALRRLEPHEAKPLSTGQARLLYLQGLYDRNPFYHYADLYKFSGEVDIERLTASFQQVVANRDILRTTFETRRGVVKQVIHSDLACPIKIFPGNLDLDEIEVEARDFARIPFDLEKGPLVSLAVFPQPKAVLVLVSMHHIVVDKWSMNVLRREWAAHYSGTYTEDLKGPFTYADYASWERRRQRSPDALAYWSSKLAGNIPVLNLPQDFQRRETQDFSGAFSKRSFSQADSECIAQAAVGLDITLFVYFLSVFKLVLYRYSSQKDIWVGTPVTNRSRKSLEKIIGFFNDTLVLRSTIEESQTVRTLLEGVRQTVLEAFGNKDVTFEQVVNALEIERDPTTNPLFRVMFLFHRKDPFPEFAPDIEVTSEPFDLGVAKFDLTMYVELVEGKLTTYLEYATDIFQSETIERFHEHLHQVATALHQDPKQHVGDVPFLTTREQAIYSQWDRTSEDGPPMPDLIGHVQQIAESDPDRLAIAHESEVLTYKELIAKSKAVAGSIQKQSKYHAGQFVGILLEPDCAMLPAILGCLGSACGYLPLDPTYPELRLKDMIAQAGTTTLITSQAHASLASQLATDLILYDELGEDAQTALIPMNADQMVYIIFTSGSTGRPKGIPISYANLKASTAARFDHYDTHPGTFLLMSSISFDSSIAGIFWTLWSGGTLVTKPDRLEQDVDALANLIAESEVTHTLMLPSLYALLLRFSDPRKLSSLQDVIVAGESCPPELVRHHFDKLKGTGLHNEYGPTESCVWSSVHRVQSEDGDRPIVPIGKAILGYQLAVLDQDLHQVPIGGIGELYIGGKGVASGYLALEEETDQRFIPLDHFGSEIFYRTGDRVIYDSEGRIYFRGRVDHQLKIRGYRIETSEVERALASVKRVAQSTLVIIHQDTNPGLAACYKGEIDETALRKVMEKILPQYMVPTKILRLDELPVLPNGKVDQQVLVEMAEHSATSFGLQQLPLRVHDFEADLIEIWQQVLNLKGVTRDQNYFELGGDSIKSIQINSLARERGLKIGPAMIFRHPTIAELALFCEPVNEQDTVYERSTGKTQVSPIQSWFFEEHATAPHFWNQGQKIGLCEPLAKEVLYKICLNVVNHHDALRSAFQQIADRWEVEYTSVQNDLDGQWHEINPIQSFAYMEELQMGLRLDRDPLIHFVVADIERISSITILAHHLIIDAVSWQILLADIERLTLQHMQGVEMQLDPPSMGPKQWTEALYEKSLAIPVEEIEYWRKQVSPQVHLPKVVSIPIREQSIVSTHGLLEAAPTSQLFGAALVPFGNRVLDFLVLALNRSWHSWTGQKECNLLLEGHGRDVMDLDVSRTIGWFTNFYPLHVALSKEGIGDQLKSIKEELAAKRKRGWQYGALRYNAQNREMPPYSAAQIVLNYLGDVRQEDSEVFQHVEFLMEGVRHAQSERHFALEFNISRVEEGLKINLSHPAELEESGVSDFLASVMKELEQLVQFCVNTEESGYTPSDFEDVDLSQDELDDLLSSL